MNKEHLHNPSHNHSDYDVIIVGAGIIGLTLACALSRAHLRCAVLEAREDPQRFDPQGPYSARVSAITRASENIFRHLQLWPAISSYRHCPYYHMKVVDDASQEPLVLSANALAQPNLGWIIENDVILTALLDKVSADPQITLYFDSPVSKVLLTPIPTVILNSGQTLTARLLVGADGAQSTLRQQVDISVYEKSYEQSAIVATVATEKTHDYTARQRFLAHGPLAFLPLADEHLCSIVWSHQSVQAKTLSALDEDTFNSLLTKAFANELGDCQVAGPRRVFPLQQMHAEHYFKPGVVLIGDAAHTIHPLAGQGLNIGLLDVACLAEVLQHAHEQQRPLASAATLRRYERQRRWHNGVVMQIMNGFHAGFTQVTATPLVQLRKWGFKLVQHSTFLQRKVMAQALGTTGPLPKLANWDSALFTGE